MSVQKYIVMALGGVESIFVFPSFIDHDRMAEAVGAVRIGSGSNWERKYRMDGEAVSAGFVSCGACHGHSETLGLKSRGDTDTALLNGSRFTGGAPA